MRDPHAFKIRCLLELHLGSEVCLQETPVCASESRCGQRLALFLLGVAQKLVLSEHGLPEQCGDDVIDLLCDDVGLHLLAFGVVREVLCHQLLVEG